MPQPADAAPSRANLSRRTISAAFGAFASGGVATAYAATPAAPGEKPKLLQLGEQMKVLLSAYRDAVEHHAECRAIAERNIPPVPDEIVFDRKRRGFEIQWSCYVELTDVEGGHLPLENFIDENGLPYESFIDEDGKRWTYPPKRVLSASIARRMLEEEAISPKWWSPKTCSHIESLIPAAEKYETAWAEAVDNSGLSGAANAKDEAARAVLMLVYEINELRPETFSGVVVWAEALAALHETQARDWQTRQLGACLAEAVINLAEGQS